MNPMDILGGLLKNKMGGGGGGVNSTTALKWYWIARDGCAHGAPRRRRRALVTQASFSFTMAGARGGPTATTALVSEPERVVHWLNRAMR